MGGRVVLGGGGASAIATDQEARGKAHYGRPKLKSNAFMMTGKKKQTKQTAAAETHLIADSPQNWRESS